MSIHNEILFIRNFYMYLYVFESHDACLDAQVEVRGQFAGVSSLPPPYGPY